MSVSYHAVGDKLSNTDPISNSVLISGLNFAQHGVNLLRPGRYPVECLNSYIHESLHHYCFRLPVGSAISYLYHRGFQRASDDAAERNHYDVLDDIVRVETVLHIMRPLAEGIALFGELDAYPGNRKSLSSVFRNTAISFAAIVPDWEELSVDQLLREVLIRGRSRSAARRRKENLLLQGFTTRNGGYLPGYFMVKNLQLALIRYLPCPKFADAEFYLNFIMHWFYGDFGLVSALLDTKSTFSPLTVESMMEHLAINAIGVAFQRRVSELFRLPADKVDTFDNLLATPDVIPSWKVQIGMEPSHAKSIEDKLMADFDHLIDVTRPGSDMQRCARALCHDNLIRRNYMCVGSFEEDIEILESGRVMLAKAEANPMVPVMAFGNSQKAGPYKGKATFDVFRSGKSDRIFYAVYAEDELVLLNSHAKGFEEEGRELAGVNLSSARCRANKAFMRDTVNSALGSKNKALDSENKALDSEGSLAILREHYREESENNTERMYRKWCGALMSILGPEADLPEERGMLLRLCNGDTTFLRALAALGAIGGPLFNEEHLREICQETGLTAAQFKARAKAVEREHSLRLLYPIDQYLVLTI